MRYHFDSMLNKISSEQDKWDTLYMATHVTRLTSTLKDEGDKLYWMQGIITQEIIIHAFTAVKPSNVGATTSVVQPTVYTLQRNEIWRQYAIWGW
jgi:hypothetical protein